MKIAVLLSGGVDSSVALRLLAAERRHELTAFYLKIWLEDDFAFLGDCPWEEDLRLARQVCAQVGVPLEVMSLQKAYWDRVVSSTVADLKAGLTPSPDILCNQRVKFGAFAEAIGTEFEGIASGHYARVDRETAAPRLLKGVDPVKDQTYFLSHLSRPQLERCIFPIGDRPKAEVRRMAADFALPNKDRRDSQGICFLGRIRYPDFVRCHLGEQPGEIREEGRDRLLGEHRGYWFHTIGQRRGLGLGGGPWFVTRKDVDRNIIYVAHEKQRQETLQTRFRVPRPHWISGMPAPGTTSLQVKIRHGARTTPAAVDISAGGVAVQLAEGDGGIAAGQYAVFYDGDHCLGGGMIQPETLLT